jgi:DNA-binding response OmpR family regulator
MPNPVAFVIEDQVNISMLYEDALRLVGYEVVALRDGLLALNALETRDVPSLIILDINLPRLSGRDLHKHIRSRDKYKNVPVIILTANSLMAERLAPEMTARDHLYIKPIGMKEFQELAKAMRPGQDGVPDYMADTQRIPHLVIEEEVKPKPKEEASKVLRPDDSLQTRPPDLDEHKFSTQEHKAIITPNDEVISLEDTDELERLPEISSQEDIETKKMPDINPEQEPETKKVPDINPEQATQPNPELSAEKKDEEK